MELIKCKVCGERHRLDEPHVGLKSVEPERRVHRTLDDDIGHHGPKARDRIEVAKAALVEPPAKFDKTAYQREYMRKQRAKAK